MVTGQSAHKPTVFVGSSKEGLEFARAVQRALDGDAEVTLWEDDLFGLGLTSIENLTEALPKFDFAVLLLTPDDTTESRAAESASPRDNVIFELGLFVGSIGRKRTFILRPANSAIKIPSDLSGVTFASFNWPRSDNNHKAAVAPNAT
jgi:predicted nucleotide-binding protein